MGGGGRSSVKWGVMERRYRMFVHRLSLPLQITIAPWPFFLALSLAGRSVDRLYSKNKKLI